MKIIEIKGVDTPFKIKPITAAKNQKLLRKYAIFGKIMDFTGYVEDFVFASVVYPKFESKKEMLDSMLPGQYAELCNEVYKINGFEVQT